MSYTDHVIKEDGWFTGEDKIIAITVYVQGTTQAAIKAGLATEQVITGWALVWRLKRNKEDPDSEALITRTTDDGITIDSTWNAFVSIAAEQTENLEEGNYYGELKRSDAGANATLSDGRYYLNRSVHNT